MYTLHVQSNTTDTSALSGKEMPCHPSAGTHGGWPALATVAQNKLLSHQRQKLRTYFTYSTPLLWFFYDFYFLLFFFHVLGQRARSFATCLSALGSVRKKKIKKKTKIFLFWPSRNQLFSIQLYWILPYPLTAFQSEWAPYQDFPVRIQKKKKNAVRDTPRSKGWGRRGQDLLGQGSNGGCNGSTMALGTNKNQNT